MKKIFIKKLYLILLTTIIVLSLNNATFAYNDLQNSELSTKDYDSISAEMLEQMELNNGKSITGNKILKHDVATRTTTEVDMEELRNTLTKQGKNNITSTPSYTPTIFSSSSIQNRNNFLTTYISNNTNNDESDLDLTKFNLVQNAHIAPYVYNCRLIIEGGEYIGTGTLVGPNVLLTAAHCVMDEEDPNHFSFSDWHAYPGYHGTSYEIEENNVVSAGLLTYYYSADWDRTEENQYDWCICVLDENIGMEVGFNGCSLYSNTNLSNLSIREFGYPRSVLNSKYQMYTTGNVQSVYTNYMVNSAICSKGMSGGPIERTSDNRIVGIISGYYTQDYRTVGVRISQYIIDLITDLCR